MSEIDLLPTDETNPSLSDKQLIDMLIPPPQLNLIHDLAKPVLIGFFFFILSLPQVDQFLQQIIPYAASSQVSLLVFKTILFIGILFVTDNIKHVLKKNLVT